MEGRPDRLSPFLWALVAAGVGTAAAPLDPNLLEEGIVVHVADRMAAGEHLYRDVVVHTAPLPYELLALLFDGLGSSLWVARGAIVLLQALAAALLFSALRRGGAGRLAHPATAALAVAPILLVPMLSIYFYTTLGFYLSFAVLYTSVRSLTDRHGAAWVAATGLGVACVALCKQTLGLALATALLPGLVLAAPRSTWLVRLAAYAGGGLAAAVATLALYTLRGDLEALLFTQIELAAAIGAADTFRMPILNLWPPGELAAEIRDSWPMYLPSFFHMRYGLHAVIPAELVLLSQLLYALPFAALAATALRALPCFAPAPPLLWLHAALLLTMTTNLYPRPDWGHLNVSLPPALAQLCLLPLRRDGAPSGRRVDLLCAGSAALLIGAAAYTGSWLYSLAGEPRFGPRVPLRPVSEAYRQPTLPRVIHYLRRRARPGEAIFVARQEPLLYFATETRNPTPFPGVLPGQAELQEGPILAALQELRFVVMSDIDQPLYTYYSDQLPRVQAYLERYFAPARGLPLDDYSWMVVLERSVDRGETLLDLLEERRRGRGRAWVRDEHGRVRDAEWTPQRLAARLLHRPLPVALDALGGGIDFELEIPDAAVFQAGVGYRGLVSVDHRYEHPRGSTVSVSVARGGADAGFEEIARRRIDDSPRGGRRWTPLEADLSAFAGERVTLRLELRTRRPIVGDRLAWWGSPRIARRP